MVKRALLSLAIMCLPLRPADAIIPVIDEALLPIAQSELVTQLKSLAQEAKAYVQDAQQLAWVMTQAQGFIQNPTLSRAMAALGAVGVTDPFGGSLPIWAVMSMTSGLATGQGMQGIMAKVSQLGSLVNSVAAINTVYVCPDKTYACAQQQQVARATAGYQGVIGRIYSQLSDHLNVTNALRSDLNDATDPAQREKIIAELQAEQNWATTAVGQLQAAGALYQSQRYADANREDQHLNQSIDAILATVPKGRGG